MYLKSLELQGFKSFADKTKIELSPGISAIVGPNGSGKSNIVEAIQWVLGEQSAKTLRGHKMPDVIFSGTKNRKPLGVAEISIVLDNSDRALDIDFSEVRVTRRLYRSGEGEYLINGSYVRLKDIHHLFADSGIGGDGYAVIGQGRISEIIDSRPEDRRAIVEETAGVVKYRERKKEALRKIGRAEDNLVRLSDIMTEIEGRLGPLKTDAANAERFLGYSEEKDRLAIGMLGETIIDSRQRLESAAAALSEAESEEADLKAEVMAKEARLDEERAALTMSDEAFHRREQQYHSLKLGVEKSEGELRTLETRILGLGEKQNLLRGSGKKQKQDLEKAASRLSGEEEEAAKVKERLDALREELRAMEDRRRDEAEDLLRAEAEMEELRSRAFEQTRSGAEKKNRKIALEEKLSAAEKRFDAIAEKFDRYDEEEDALVERFEELSDRVDDISFDRGNVEAEQRKCREAMDAAAAGIDRKKEALMALRMEVNRSEAHLKVLEEMTLKREGFYPGVRAVLERKSSSQRGIYGVIAELIRVDKEYTLAIESVLGSALQNIVTAKGEDAAAAVAYLKENRRGTATFLPLDLLRVQERKTLPKDIRENKNYLGNAADKVSCPQRVRDAVEYLLGNTLLIADLPAAVAISRRHKGQYRLVTPEGDVINAGGSVTGGSGGKNKNVFLSRQNEIEELRRGLLAAEKKEKKLLAEIEEEEEKIARTESSLESLIRRGDAFRAEITSLEGEIGTIRTHRELIDKERESLTLERDELEGDCLRLKEDIKDALNRIEEADREEKTLLAEIGRREEMFKTAKSSEDRGRDEYTTLQVSFAETKSAYDAVCQRIDHERALLKELEEAALRNGAELEAAQEESAAAEARRAELEAAVLAKNKELLNFDDSLGDEKARREERHEAIAAAEKELKASRDKANAARDRVYQLSLRTERLRLETEQCEEQLREEYRMVLADAVPYIDREKTKKEKRERIKTLKAQIEALGPVNVGAIEEYESVSRRFDFLREQKEDVLEAKASLKKIVADMDRIIGKLFMETFSRINESFQQTFPAFFRGGHGELRLTDEEDPLTCGVEIAVQPPGKRLQHLSLLSGGEKSLSGIALLFAILKVKPSPFYVLDEIDAALDDVNVKRFADYLVRYGENSQFMVITHRQGTMEAAATMYGVTMAEEGVSKTVSVRLD